MKRRVWVFVLPACLGAAPVGSSGAADVMTVTLLGTGVPFPSPDRFGAAILVEAGEQILLVDCGRGATIRLQQADVPASRVRSVFLTHFHSDHVAGLPDLWLTGWILGRSEPLAVRGPEGTPEMTEHLVKAYAEDLRIRQSAPENLPSRGAGIRGEAVEPGVVFAEGGVRVIAFLVDHGHVSPAFGYRIEHAGRSVVVSGDAKPSQNLIEAATGADLLLQSAWMTEARNPTPPALRSIASAEDAGRVFAKARPRLAVLYHYAEETGIEEAVRENYQGSFVIGRDRMEIEVGDTTKWRGGR